jgi:hypothetical protein
MLENSHRIPLASLAEGFAENVCDESVRIRRERSPGRTGSRAERVRRAGHKRPLRVFRRIKDADDALHAAVRLQFGEKRKWSQLPKTFATKVYGFGANEAQVEQARGLKESDGLVMVPSLRYVSAYDWRAGSECERTQAHHVGKLPQDPARKLCQEPDSVSLQRAISRASVDSYTVPDRASTPDSRAPIRDPRSGARTREDRLDRRR